MKAVATLVGAAAFIALATWLFYREPDTLEDRLKAERAGTQVAGKAPATAPSIVLSINAAKPSQMPRAVDAPAVPTVSREFAQARALKPLYDRLTAAGGDSTADAKFVLYKIVATCAKRTDLKKEDRPVKDRATRRRELEALIQPSDPDRARRLAIFDSLGARCDGFESMTTTRAELERLLAEAARAGDPKAQARLATPKPEDPAGPMRLNLSDEQYRSLQAAIASRDPEAILIAGTALSNTFDDAVLQVGPDRDLLHERASMEAWRLVACEYGLECGADNPTLRMACAFAGQCAATNVQDQVFFYGVTPHEAQLIDQYRRVFRNAVANNDWSGLQLSRQPNGGSSRYYFGTSP